MPALLRLYGEWAADRLGPLTRTGPADLILTAHYLTGAAEVTLALDAAGRPVGSVRWTRGVGDEALTALQVEPTASGHEHRCMHALLDVPAAFEARRGIPGLSTALPFRVEGAFAEGVDGGYELVADSGELRCAASESSTGPVFTARGLAALYGGAQRCSALRAAGLLHGPAEDDPTWDAMCSTPFQLRDYF